ncbi:hypothetical protein BXZ70DRAFT_936574 [Cristinia sonorae]|uniref:Uncharacterized protein n=1 Tax=Cristinia sonorae TaxID=1940300 RepID=A0A8K0URC5_9AGAR|nr:hypothetical protein BXZ70DRAFT_936574 [Cristinia sonorae]
MFPSRSKIWSLIPAFLSLTVTRTSVAEAAAVDTQCSTFNVANVTNAVVTGRTFYKKGDNVTVVNPYQFVSTRDLPVFCRIELLITTNVTANSQWEDPPLCWMGRELHFCQ